MEDEALPIEGEPEPWRPPVACPQCSRTRTRFVTLHYELAVYECELCEIEFEVEPE